MKISRLEAIPFRIRMSRAEHYAKGAVEAIEHVLLRLHTSDGLVAHAEAPPRRLVYGETIASICTILEKTVQPLLSGVDIFDDVTIDQRLGAISGNAAAKAAVDIAIHDARGQALGKPVYELLGGRPRPIMLTHILGLATPEETAENAVKAIAAHGFTSLKLKVGVDPARDTATIAQVRRAVGPAVRLYVDANQNFPAPTAVELMRRWEEFDIAWIEEPCSSTDLEGRALIARSSQMPVMADESCKSMSALRAEIDRGWIRLLSIKCAGTGYKLSRTILEACAIADITPVTGSQGDGDVGTIAAAHFNIAHSSLARMPAELSYFLDISDQITSNTFEVANGVLNLSSRPGLGLVVDDDKINRFRIDR